MAKNIVLLSDGTGNSASHIFKTNVWRFYQGVNINPPSSDGEPRQLVFYDDGVGTGNFKPIAAMGLALGLGLEENIKDLYTFLCRNYEKGDNIFLLGFSRGAFTVRMLAGMVLRCGLVGTDNNEKVLEEKKLLEQVDIAYDAYRRDGARRATATGRAQAGGLLFGDYHEAQKLEFVPLGDQITQIFPQIAFIGVWDTVDAYGMPVDEIKLAIDRFIWPMTLADRNLSPHVERACHALSLDDERPTFRPVLWSEVRKDDNGDETPVNEKQLTQVWFSGVHANVGGGYPDDGLSQVTMQWMMDEAQERGLWFYDWARDDVDDRANPHGKQYDSRAGLAAYYRYGPRSVDELCDDPEHGVKVTTPKVHLAALARIKEREVAYAPLSFPTDYTVVERDAAQRGLVRSKWEEVHREQRIEDMKDAWDTVARRRSVYFLIVVLTVLLATLPLVAEFWRWLTTPRTVHLVHATSVEPISFVGIIETIVAWGLGFLESVVTGFLGLAQDLLWLPAWWLCWYEDHPWSFLLVALPLGWLFVRTGGLLQDEVFSRADYAWRGVRRLTIVKQPARARGDQAVRFLRERTAGKVSKNGRLALHAVIAVLIGVIGSIAWILFFIPSHLRIRKLREKYAVRPTQKKDGTKPREIIKRIPCKIQPYKRYQKKPAQRRKAPKADSSK